MTHDIAESNIHALTDFLQNHKRHLVRLRKAGQPNVLTINGKAELVIQDARSYQKMLDRVERAEAITGIKRGLADVKAGRTMSARKALATVRRVPSRFRKA